MIYRVICVDNKQLAGPHDRANLHSKFVDTRDNMFATSDINVAFRHAFFMNRDNQWYIDGFAVIEAPNE